MWNNRAHVVSAAAGQSTSNYIHEDDIESDRPPPPGKEYTRESSPPPSIHSSDDDDFDLSAYIEKRKNRIGADFWKKQAELTNLNYCSGGPNGFTCKDVTENELYGPGRPKPIIMDDSMVMYGCNYDDEENSSDSDYSNPDPTNEDGFMSTIQQILKDAADKRNSDFFATIPGGAVEGINFCWRKFQNALQMKWSIIMLQRFEEILKGRGQSLKEIPEEWKDFKGQFASIYGPMNVKSESYAMLLSHFQASRLKMYIDMLERERDVIGTMLESDKRISEWSPTALAVTQCRLKLETKLGEILEAHLDMNPYSNKIHMDFFVLPRPTHKIRVFAIRPKELDNLIEYNNDDVTPRINDVDIVEIEGYNPAVLDVGCTFSDQVVWDQKCLTYYSDTYQNKKAVKALYKNQLNLKAEIQEYPVGVESKVLVRKFRNKWEYVDGEPVFEKYSDEEGVLVFSDVVYPQYLGKDKRVILFPSLYEGLIVAPEKILLRIWKRIKHLLEMRSQNSAVVTDLQKNYEELFGQPLYPLNWGFSDVDEFIEYSLQTFCEDLGDVNCVKKDEVAETEAVEETEISNDVEVVTEQDLNYWLALDESLPVNYVFKVPNPNPFDIIVIVTTNCDKINLDTLLKPFSECLVHISTYTVIPPNLSNTSLKSTKRKLKIGEFLHKPLTLELPTIISRYKLVERFNKAHEKTEFTLVLNNSQSRPAFLFTARPYNLPCSIQIYMVKRVENNRHIILPFGPPGHEDVIFPLVPNENGALVAYQNISSSTFTITKHNAFQVLITRDLNRILNSWNEYVDTLAYNTITTRFTKILVHYPQDAQFIEYYGMLFTYPDYVMYYPTETYFAMLFPEQSECYKDIQMELDGIMIELAKSKRQFVWMVSTSREDRHTTYNILYNMTDPGRSDLHGKPLSFRMFLKWMVIEFFVFNVAFPNSTLTSFSAFFANGQNAIAGNMYFDKRAAIFMNEKQVGLQFITCGGRKMGFLSLYGYASAFDDAFWKCLSIFILSFSILLVCTAKINTSRSLGNILLGAVSDPYAVLLEQGIRIQKYRSSTHYTWFTFILMGVVVSNCYKGNNITKLSAPLGLTNVKLFAELEDNHFEIFSRLFNYVTFQFKPNYQANLSFAEWMKLKTDRNQTVLCRLSKTAITNALGNVLSKLCDNTHELTHKEINEGAYNHVATVTEGYLHYIKKCDRTAFITWSDEIQEAEPILKRILSGRVTDRKTVNKMVSVGKEIASSWNVGWEIRGCKYLSAKFVAKRLASVLESGIGMQWNKWGKWVKAFNDIATAARTIDGPVRMKMDHNVIVVFFVHFILLTAAFAVVLVEVAQLLVVQHSLVKGISKLAKPM
ncbi:unnamed protein product [Orchesella dallaii]|uniref:Uncharacterized protein n=1 Tax=Orchesella dallaii TaxID=48710 RepID=A0ABP1QJN7_9HEXA